MRIKDLIGKHDSKNQFKVLQDTYKQILSAWNNNVNLSHFKKNNYNSIVYCGLGGSAISGDLLQDYLSNELKFPFKVVRGYDLPSFTNKDTLVIISSYSGNTEETISCFHQALKINCSIIAITSGGKIFEEANKNKIPVIKIEGGFQPRYALGLSFFSLLRLMQELEIVNEENTVKKIIDLWKKQGEELAGDKNKAVEIAEQMIGFIPVIYSAEFLSSTGYRFKCQVNENSKLHAFYNTIPEMNHNEIIGWESYREKQFQVKIIYLLDKEYNPQNRKRFNILKEILSEQKVEVLVLESNEQDRKVRIMDLIFLCDWISFYLSVLRGFDPSEIDFIHQMKKRLV
jgi:glucose/mannose-6-phosphate isomerase